MEGTYQLILDPTLRRTTSTAQNELIRREKCSGVDGEARERVGYMSGAHLVSRTITDYSAREQREFCVAVIDRSEGSSYCSAVGLLLGGNASTSRSATDQNMIPERQAPAAWRCSVFGGNDGHNIRARFFGGRKRSCNRALHACSSVPASSLLILPSSLPHSLHTYTRWSTPFRIELLSELVELTGYDVASFCCKPANRQ